jgi:hypothetical protein
VVNATGWSMVVDAVGGKDLGKAFGVVSSLGKGPKGGS